MGKEFYFNINKNTKYLGVNLIKIVQDLYKVNDMLYKNP